MAVIATAGHVDHGKSTLVRTLTGVDPDRWAEEKERGLTIDLGFAPCELRDGTALSFVDVPGHIRFLRNMLAGVGAVDGALVVIDANEGWMPQTEEHVRILDLLGVTEAVVVITKAATVDADIAELAGIEASTRLEGTALADSEIVLVDSLAGIGLDALDRALAALVARIPARGGDQPRLWVDRAFAATGSGTVVTGTSAGGTLTVGDEVVVGAAQHEARVRRLQIHGADVESVGPGERLAVNLAGVSWTDVSRGDAVIRADQWHHTAVFDASLQVLASLDHAVSRRGAYHAYIGSSEQPARIRVLGPDAIEPAGSGLIRVRIASPLPLVPGDRFILRETGRDETVGGGEVLDVDPQLPAAKARPDRDPARVIAERGVVDRAELRRLIGPDVEVEAATVGRWAVAPERLTAIRAELAEAAAGAEGIGVDLSTFDDVAREVAATLEDHEIVEGRLRPVDAADPLADHPAIAALAAEPFNPPDVDIDPAHRRELVRRGLLVEQDGRLYAPAAIEGARQVVAGLLQQSPDGVTVADVRDALGTTRKHALPILAELDGRGVTRRRGDLRIAGPRIDG